MTLFTYPDVFSPIKADGSLNTPDLGQAHVNNIELHRFVQMTLFDGRIYSTRAALYADLAHAANSWALVIGDPTSGYDGLYQKSGASGSGSWSRVGDVPGSGFIKGTDSGAGTPNAIQVTSPTIPATDGAALIVFNIFEANTGSPVTVSFNGGTALTIKTNTGNDVATGGLTANMMVAGFKSGSTFRLISDQVSAAIVAAAEAAQAAAEAARDIAVAAASSVQALRASRADAVANYHPTSAPDFILTAGYASAGDGGGALYKKVVSEPSHPGKLSITLSPSGTAWYQIVPDIAGINPLALGVVMDGTIAVNNFGSLTNYANTAALQAASPGAIECVKVDEVAYMRITKDHPRLGPEKVVNGAFAADASWTKGANWTISAGVATKTAGAANNLSQSASWLTAGKNYLTAFNITAYTANGTLIYFTGGTQVSGTSRTAVGYYEQVLTALTGNNTINMFGPSAMAMSIDNVSIRELPSDAVQSADGYWWAPFRPRYTPFGTGAVTGTDNRLAVIDVQAVSEALGVQVLWPAGNVRVLVPNGSAQDLVTYGTYGLRWVSLGRTRFIIDDPSSYTAVGQTGNCFIASSQYRDSGNYNRVENNRVLLDGIVFQGTWWRDVHKGGRSWTAAQPYRCHAIAPTNTRNVVIRNCDFVDIMGFGVLGRSNGMMEFYDNFVNRVCGNGLRAEDSPAIFRGNRGLDVDDDWITATDLDDRPNDLGPRINGVQAIDNYAEKCEGALFYGPLDLVMKGNTEFLCYGTGFSVFATLTDVAERGEGGFAVVEVSGNRAIDHLKAHALASPPDGTWGGDVNAMTIIGAVAAALSTGTAIGEGTGSPVELPWSGIDYPWGALRLSDQVGSDGKPDESSGYRGAGLIIANNILMRTLPAASYYSDWGYGFRFTRWGYDNPAVTDAEFALYGLRLGGSFDGADIHLGHISGFISGAGVYLGNASTDFRYKNVKFHGGQIINVKFGFSSDAGSTKYQDIVIDGVVFDIDPFRIQSARAAGNKWSSLTASDPTAIGLTHLRGLTIINNEFANCALPWALEGGAVSSLQYNRAHGNVGICEVPAAGTSETHADNRGLGRIYRAGTQITYKLKNLDPTSGSFGQDQAGMLQYSAAKPTTGAYVIGHQISTLAGIYLRLTTDPNAHVTDTDWKLM